MFRRALLVISLISIFESTAIAREGGAPSLLDDLVVDEANILSAGEISQIKEAILDAEKNGALLVRFHSETTMIRLTPAARAKELANQLSDDFVAAHPDRPVTRKIQLDTTEGVRIPATIPPLPLVFYFVRGSRDGSNLLLIGGFETLESEIGTPLATKYYVEMLQLYVEQKSTGNSPAPAIIQAIRDFSRKAGEARTKAYSFTKNTGQESGGSTAWKVVVIGGILAAIVFLVLRKIGGERRTLTPELELPKLQIPARLGGRHSGGMTSTVKWQQTPGNHKH